MQSAELLVSLRAPPLDDRPVADDGTIRRFIEHSASEHASILEGQMDQFTIAPRRLAAEPHDGRLRVRRIKMNGVSNGHRCSIASSEDAASLQGWLSSAMPGPHRPASVKGSCKRDAFLRFGFEEVVQSTGPVLKVRQYGAHFFGDFRREGVDLTGPGVIARRARAGHDAQTLDDEATAQVLALRAEDWERLTGIWQRAALSVFTRCAATSFRRSDAISGCERSEWAAHECCQDLHQLRHEHHPAFEFHAARRIHTPVEPQGAGRFHGEHPILDQPVTTKAITAPGFGDALAELVADITEIDARAV